MTISRFHIALALAGAFAQANAQWEPLGAPGVYSVVFLVAHKDKAYAGIERSLFVGEREGVGRTVFHPVDPLSNSLTTGLSWGEQFVTGNNVGRVVVYADVATAQRRIEGHPTIQRITSLAAVGHVLLMGSYEGVHRSTDTLQSAVLSSAAAGFVGVNQIEVFDSLVYAASDSGLFVSRDSGASWSKVATPRRKVNDAALFRDTLFAATEAGLYRSADNGASWLDPLWPTERFPRLLVRGERLFATTQTDLWRLGPDAAPWTRIHLGMAGQYLDFATLGRTEIIGSNAGVALSEEGGPWEVAKTSFTPTSPNLQALTHDGNLILAGSDGRGAFVSSDRGRTWTMRSHPYQYGGVYGILANAMHDGIWYSTTLKGIHRSADSGTTWDLANTGLPTDFSSYGFLENGTRLWLATSKGMFFTENHGDTWSAPPGRPAGKSVYDLAITRDGTLWAATDTGLQKSSPPFQTWTLSTDLPRGTTVRLAARGDTLYASSSAEGPWRSVDGGATWNVVRNGLPNAYLQRILPGTHHAFAANGLGDVFVIGHADTSWQSFQGNLPDSDVGAPMLLDDTVYLWSKFRSLYRRALPSPTSGVSSGRDRSVAPFVHDAGSLRFREPSSLVGATVRDLAGRAILRAGAQAERLSLAGLPAGVYTVSVEVRDRPGVVGVFLQR